MVNEWTRDDLPSLPDVLGNVTLHERAEGAAAYRTAALAHLNAHHPKPTPGPLSSAADCVLDAEDRASAAKSEVALWRRAHELAERERDQPRRERDAAVARAEEAEQLIPAYAMLDIWMALGRDSIHFDDWCDEHGYADAWAELTSAVREARTAPAVPLHQPDGTRMDAPHLPIDADDDPAVFVVLESDIAAVEVKRNEDRSWRTKDRGYGEGSTAKGLRQTARLFIQDAVGCEAVARAIEAEQAVDPVEELAGQIETATRDAIRTVVDSLTAVAPGLTPPDVEGLLDQTIRDQSHTIAAHVLGQKEDQ